MRFFRIIIGSLNHLTPLFPVCGILEDYFLDQGIGIESFGHSVIITKSLFYQRQQNIVNEYLQYRKKSGKVILFNPFYMSEKFSPQIKEAQDVS